MAFEQTRLHLEPGKRYLLSAWVSRDSIDRPTYRSPDALPAATRLGLQVVFHRTNRSELSRDSIAQPISSVIDGWQRIEQPFTVPDSAAYIDLRFQNGDSASYFDDVRVQPFDASMETYVYESSNLRLIARLDGNNFAELYGYDPEGSLTVVNRETVNGFMTLREIRAHTRERP